MNKFILITLIFSSQFLFAQKEIEIAWTKQSSTHKNFRSDYAVDRSDRTFSKTNPEETPWFKIGLPQNTLINSMSIHGQNLNNYYVFFSEKPFLSTSISNLLNDPYINYIYVEGDQKDFEIKFNAQEILIAKKWPDFDFVDILINDLQFDGLTIYEVETCTGGVDDDGDGLVDCNDIECSVGTYNINGTCPSADGQVDGQICFNAQYGNTIEISGPENYGLSFLPNKQGTYNGCLDNLPAGEYEIMITNNSTGCSITEQLDLTCGYFSECNNLDFEDDNFTNWNGMTATNNWGLISNFTQGLDIPTSHQVFDVSTFTDPNVPTLNLSGLTGGIARIGNMAIGGNVATISHCFTVTPDQTEIKFFFSFIGDFTHNLITNPFFNILVQSGTDNIYTEIINSNSTILEPGINDIAYTPFDCREIDVSDYVGSEVCVTFRVSGCGQGGHEGYAYIDLFCEDDNIDIQPSLLYNVLECGDIELVGSGQFFNQGSFSIFDLNGNMAQTPVIEGINPTFQNAVSFFESETGVDLACDHNLYVTFQASNSCDYASISEFIQLECPPSPVVTEFEVEATGCDGGNFRIYGQGTNYESWYFKIGNHNFATNAVTNIISTSPTFGGSPDLQDVAQFYMDQTNSNLNCEIENLKITLVLVSDCGIETEQDLEVDMPCLTFKVFAPNAFAPNSSIPANAVFRTNIVSPDYQAGGSTPDCSSFGNDITSITFYALSVYNVFGERVFYGEVFSPDGLIDGSEIGWDGTFNGVMQPIDAYAFVAVYESCGNYFRCDNFCNGIPSCTPSQCMCSTGVPNPNTVDDLNGNPHLVESIQGNVTLIL